MQVAIATITWARDEAEGVLLRRCIARLQDTGLPVVVGDAGTDPSFLEFLRDQRSLDVVVAEARGLVPQVQAAMERAGALGTPFVFYTESDKEFFFRERMQGFLERAVSGEPAVTLAARSEASLASYPPAQQYTEGFINGLCSETFGAGGDYSYGPFLMPRGLLPAVAAANPTLGWGWRHALFAAAHRNGIPIRHIVDDYPCPADQREEDAAERRHRLRQLAQNILGLID